MNILILDTVDKKLTAKLGESATTNPVFTAHYYDSASGVIEHSSDGAISGTSAVDVVTAPNASKKRIIKEVTVFNGDDKTHELTLMINNDGVERIIYKGDIQQGKTFVLSSMLGVAVAGTPSEADVTTQHSIQGDGSAGDPVQLVGDEATPDGDSYYGTNNKGAKGYYELQVLNEDQKRKITYGTEEPTGGADGDIYMQYDD